MKPVYLAITLSLTLASCATKQERVNILEKTRHGTTVEAPQPCPDWSRSSGGGVQNLDSSNFGCTTLTNYGVMIENKDDMIKGKSSPYNSGARATAAITAYETRPASTTSFAPASGGGE